MSDRLKPLNRAARAAGNPASSLFESSVGNCFPGLEFDVRNLDRRFFPGLVFDFLGTLEAGPDGNQGAKLVQIEAYDDPMLAGTEDWVKTLSAAFDDAEGVLSDGDWWLHAIEQDGNRIELYEFLYWQNSVTRVAYEGETVWWLIRSLGPDAPVTVELTRRARLADGKTLDPQGRPDGQTVRLTGKRRTYVNAEGLFDAIYRPGELTSSMCSPWTHDFRDCACQYWASNHPDVALGVVAKGDAIPGGASASDPAEAINFLDWMRRRTDPGRDVSAATTIDEARKYRYDPYEINTKWEELSFVLEGREVDRAYEPPKLKEGGYESPEKMVGDLVSELAPLEMALIIEYLYAMFTLKSPDDEEARSIPGLSDALRAARQLILLTAINEMTHLRWANQLIWRLDKAGIRPPGGQPYEPVVRPAKWIAGVHGQRNRALRALTSDVLAEFVHVERPGGDVDAEYFHVVQELRKPDKGYPLDLYAIAVRIDSDGMQHFERFRDVQRILAPWFARADTPWLRKVKLAPPEDTPEALADFDALVDLLKSAYAAEAAGDIARAGVLIDRARGKMRKLNEECEALFAQGVGVDFFSRWKDDGS